MTVVADITYIVGGKGNGTAKSNDHGGGYTDNYAGTWANAQGTNGGSVNSAGTWGGSQSACTITNNGSGKVRVTYSGHGFDSAAVGMLANIETNDATYTDDRYEVLATNNYTYVDLDLAYVSDKTCDIRVGGALATVNEAISEIVNQEATDIIISQDLTIAVSATSGLAGYPQDDKWLQFIGTDNEGVELTTGNYRTIDAEGNDITGPILGITGGVGNVRFKHLWAYNNDTTQADNYGFSVILATTSYSYEFVNCKASKNYQAFHFETYRVKNILMRDCVGMESGHQVLYNEAVTLIIKDCLLNGTGQSQDTILYNNASYSLTCLDTIFIGAKNGAQQDWVGQGVITFIGCIFYNQTVTGIQIAHQNLGLIAWNNIFMPAVGASDYGIYRPTRGTVIDADYNCYWSVDGQQCLNYAGANGDHDLAEDPRFKNAGAGDFTIQNSKLLESGYDDGPIGAVLPTRRLSIVAVATAGSPITGSF